MKKKILITGANGYIGSHLVNALCERHSDEYEITATDICDSNIDKRANIVVCDLLKEAYSSDLYVKMGRPDICVYLAWQDGFDHNAESHMENLYLHFRFIKNLIDAGTTHFVVAGSFREYGTFAGKADENLDMPACNYYVLAKKTLHNAIDIYIKDKNVCLQWIRPFTVYGDDELNNSIMSKILIWDKEGKQSFPFTEGNEEYDYIEVNELAEQIIAIASQTQVQGTINCCSGKPTRLKDKINEFIESNHLRIKPDFGKYKARSYDSGVIYGDRKKLDIVLKNTNNK